MDRSNHSRLALSELRADVLDGAVVFGPGDERIGSVAQTHGSGETA